MSEQFLIVSNRLPAVIEKEDGEWTSKPGAGGLVTALKPVLREYGGTWIGWPGETEDAPVEKLLANVGEQLGCTFEPVLLDEELVEGYYYGFSNETLWPLFHDLLGFAKFERAGWKSYIEANRRFAEVISEHAGSEQILWIHDYQLMLTAAHLRELGVGNPLGFFLHIPFPSPDIFSRLPWRHQLMEALLRFDLAGFQTERDLRNFRQCVRRFVPAAEVSEEGKFTIRLDGRSVRTGFFPISIDFEEFDRMARSEEVQQRSWYIHEGYGDQQLILGADRLDYTKGIPARIRGFERALEKYPDLRGKVSMAQLLVPSRERIEDYAKWREELERMTAEVNGRFADRGWTPLHYQYRSLPFSELLGYYRASEICLVSSLKDGMNLVCKEFCACSVDGNGVLILSEFAGAAPQMENEGAIMVNPHDEEQVADAIHQAVLMPAEERRERMERLRKSVRENDVFRWVKSFLDELTSLARETA